MDWLAVKRFVKELKEMSAEQIIEEETRLLKVKKGWEQYLPVGRCWVELADAMLLMIGRESKRRSRTYDKGKR